MSYNYGNLNNLFLQYAYTKAKEEMNKGGLIDQALHKALDVNNDGVIDKKDKTLIDAKAKEDLKNKKLFDITGDGNISYEDLLAFNKNLDAANLNNSKYEILGSSADSSSDLNNKALAGDFDGDGKVSDYELSFLQSQSDNLQDTLLDSLKTNKKNLTLYDFLNFEELISKSTGSHTAQVEEYEKTLMKYINANSNFDLDKDKDKDFNDYAEFLSLTNGKFDNASSSVKDFLETYKKRIATEAFDKNGNGGLGTGDLAILANQVLQAQKYIDEGKTDLSAKLLKTYDVDGDGDFDKDDLANLKAGLANYMSYLGIKDVNGDGTLNADDLKKLDADLKAATKGKNDATKALNDAKSAETTAKSKYDSAVNAENSALKAKNTADKKLKEYEDAKAAASTAITTKKAAITTLNTELSALLAEKNKLQTSGASASDIAAINQKIADKRSELNTANTELRTLETNFKNKYETQKAENAYKALKEAATEANKKYETAKATTQTALSTYETAKANKAKAETISTEANSKFTAAKTAYEEVKGLKSFIDNYKG